MGGLHYMIWEYYVKLTCLSKLIIKFWKFSQSNDKMKERNPSQFNIDWK
jgi:hypothetical protein